MSEAFPSRPVVLSVGQCRPDQAAISHYLKAHFQADVKTADDSRTALQTLSLNDVTLVLINRVFDLDGSSGLDLLKLIREKPAFAAVPIMLVSNYEQWQREAVAQGAIYGFGKAELNRSETRARLAAVLTAST